jgi:feruloyl-CoA synthase
LFADLLATEPTAAVDAAMQATGPDTITKFLFTSGSTKLPKAVINTHGMWCANQQQIAQTMPDMVKGPPVLVDWLPWNHTFGGNKNIGLALYRRHGLYRRGQAYGDGHCRDAAQSARDLSHRLLQRTHGLRIHRRAMESDAQLRSSLLKRVNCSSTQEPLWRSPSGIACTARRRPSAASAS